MRPNACPLCRRAENRAQKRENKTNEKRTRSAYYVIGSRQEAHTSERNGKCAKSNKNKVAVAAAAGRRRKSRLRTISECFVFCPTHRLEARIILRFIFLLSRASASFAWVRKQRTHAGPCECVSVRAYWTRKMKHISLSKCFFFANFFFVRSFVGSLVRFRSRIYFNVVLCSFFFFFHVFSFFVHSFSHLLMLSGSAGTLAHQRAHTHTHTRSLGTHVQCKNYID